MNGIFRWFSTAIPEISGQERPPFGTKSQQLQRNTFLTRLDTKSNLDLKLRHERGRPIDGQNLLAAPLAETPAVTKKEIVKTISDEIGLTQLKTKEIVQKTFDAIVETLVEDGRIELRNFGVFEVKKRAARKARNPRTGERVDVAEKYVVTFKPGKEMEERVRELERQAAERKAAQARDASHAASMASNDRRPMSTTHSEAASVDQSSGYNASYAGRTTN